VIHFDLQVRKWIANIHEMDDRCVGYKPHRATPYMHMMAYHVPNFIWKYGNIKMFSCQGSYYYDHIDII